jgi:Zn-finger nucleic acid-binding protein
MDLRCPQDGHALRQGQISGHAIGTCRHCDGLWISDAARRHTDLPSEAVPLAARRGRPAEPAPVGRRCAACREVMASEKHSGLTIDICRACGGAWLDAGEFDAVRHALLHQSTPVVRRQHWLLTEHSGWTWGELAGETVLRLVLSAIFDG